MVNIAHIPVLGRSCPNALEKADSPATGTEGNFRGSDLSYELASATFRVGHKPLKRRPILGASTDDALDEDASFDGEQGKMCKHERLL